mmetsp:Transcript_44311/g.102331  ORF Transcript_44311/g.102331 Transcript_44311/m.102331 type:complete len:193 (-) Transcript_44311:126-704(-)|eukprot:CAMPEP_0171090564 /NCGR_PEP_ID=MMETSP0766_2-20121228/31937_1 /TAXON_ID=439317 /ORGANISM="Gambierdiscus australes, Strain CAWD 149" /LENGTH=192 /DNA_ID=CAMNT_0011548573 /DNA_START=76 /DNA_END=654 /DNA_ORIENTATION=+
MVEYEYDMTRWKNAKVWSGGTNELWNDWDDVKDPRTMEIHPKDMMDYDGLTKCYTRDLFSKAVCIDGDTYLEVIKLQDDLKFHFYYTGIDPEDGTEEPKSWLCLVVYEKRHLPAIVKGLKSIGVDIADADEDPVEKDTEDLGFQMMLRASDAFITFCDPWLKKMFTDAGGELQPGTVYHYQDEVVKKLVLRK